MRRPVPLDLGDDRWVWHRHQRPPGPGHLDRGVQSWGHGLRGDDRARPPSTRKTQLEARALPEAQRHVDTPTTLEARLLAAAQARGAVDERLAAQIRSRK